MSSSNTNSWLKAKKKTELTEMADRVGLKSYKDLRKSDLEAALDDFIARHAARFSSDPQLAGYFTSRSKTAAAAAAADPSSSSSSSSSSIKKETAAAAAASGAVKDELEKGLKLVKRRVAKVADDATTDISSSSLVRTPARSLAHVAARIPLPASPADVALAVDRSALAVRRRLASLYHDTGIPRASDATRDTLSTVTSVVVSVALFELYHIRRAILADRFAFSLAVPSILPALTGTGTTTTTTRHDVHLPDMFLLLSASFWSPALTWALTAIVLPCLFGYFFNLDAAAASHNSQLAGGGPRTRAVTFRAHQTVAVIDPLTFSIAKALLAYLVYAQGLTFGGLLSELSIARLNNAVYGGYQGVLVGTAITGLVSMYEAVLRR